MGSLPERKGMWRPHFSRQVPTLHYSLDYNMKEEGAMFVLRRLELTFFHIISHVSRLDRGKAWSKWTVTDCQFRFSRFYREGASLRFHIPCAATFYVDPHFWRFHMVHVEWETSHLFQEIFGHATSHLQHLLRIRKLNFSAVLFSLTCMKYQQQQ